jgi:hypothetical protein
MFERSKASLELKASGLAFHVQPCSLKRTLIATSSPYHPYDLIAGTAWAKSKILPSFPTKTPFTT